MKKVMDEHEVERLQNTVKAMSPEEQVLVLSAIEDTDLLWEEIMKREREERAFKKRMEDFVYNR